jgi:SET and MYND domain-containing protein
MCLCIDCDMNCQRSDWKQHKEECKIIPELLKCDLLQENIELLSDIRLLITVTQSCKTITNCHIDNSISICGTSHINKLTNGNLKNNNNIIIDIIKNINILKDIPIEYIIQLLNQFTCNNFGIMNNLLQCIGSGIYPCSALLNHSCNPNCILRYHISKNRNINLEVCICICIYYHYIYYAKL